MDVMDTTEQGMLSRATTLDASLSEASSSVMQSDKEDSVMNNWAFRAPAANDLLLRSKFLSLLDESRDAPPDEKLIMYDAVDESEVRAQLGPVFRKRLDARRNTKPKKSDDQVLVCTPFNENGFHFGKIRNEREKILKLELSSGRYELLTNKFPLFPKHMLLVAKALVAQQMTHHHLLAITEVLHASTFCAYFNSWCASASVNHFHCHLIDEFPPVTAFPLVAGPMVGGARCLTPQGFPGFCYVFPTSQLGVVDEAIRSMQADNQPHNLLFTPRYIYVFPKPLVRPARSFELYPETVGGPELIGSFTVYTSTVYEGLCSEHVDELVRINTAPLPSRLLQFAGTSGATAVDDAAVHAASTTERASRKAIASSLTLDYLPQLGYLHDESLPQDRPIARALAASAMAFV